MRTSPGLSFTLGALVLLCAGLAGGQVWALTGSTALGIAAGVGVGAGLGAAVRPLLRRVDLGRRVLGEHRGTLDESQFVDVVGTLGADSSPRGAIARGVAERPDRVAGSIRSLLEGADQRPGASRRRERKGKK